MAVPPRYPDAVRELRPVPRARFLLAGERGQADIVIARVFGEAPQVRVLSGIRGVTFAGKWGRAGRSAAAGGGRELEPELIKPIR